VTDGPNRVGHTVAMEPTPPPVTVIVAASGSGDDLVDALGVDEIEVVTTTDPGGALDAVRSGPPDIVVIRTDDGLDGCHDITSLSPATRIVAVGSADPVALIDAGIGAQVPAERVADDLASAVVGLAHGEATFDVAMAAHLVDRVDQGGDVEPLSDTEREVLTRLAAGDDVDELASTHGVSPRMVRVITGGVLARVQLA